MADKSQLLKGTLEGCVLKVIEKNGTVYGYEICRILNERGFENISEGTLYPLYTRLQKNGLIKATLRVSELGPMRKYFSLTQEGKKALTEFETNWNLISRNIKNIWNYIP